MYGEGTLTAGVGSFNTETYNNLKENIKPSDFSSEIDNILRILEGIDGHSQNEILYQIRGILIERRKVKSEQLESELKSIVDSIKQLQPN